MAAWCQTPAGTQQEGAGQKSLGRLVFWLSMTGRPRQGPRGKTRPGALPNPHHSPQLRFSGLSIPAEPRALFLLLKPLASIRLRQSEHETVPGPQDAAARMVKSSEGYLLPIPSVVPLHQTLVPLARRADPPDSISLRTRAWDSSGPVPASPHAGSLRTLSPGGSEGRSHGALAAEVAVAIPLPLGGLAQWTGIDWRRGGWVWAIPALSSLSQCPQLQPIFGQALP